MKNILLIAAVLFGLSAQAATNPDELQNVFRCVPTEIMPDNSMLVEVFEGGIAGIPQIRVTHYYFGHSPSEVYLAKKARQNGRPGSPLVYAGRDIRLSMNFSTSPLKDGGHYSTLQIRNLDEVENYELSCKSVSHR